MDGVCEGEWTTAVHVSTGEFHRYNVEHKKIKLQENAYGSISPKLNTCTTRPQIAQKYIQLW